MYDSLDFKEAMVPAGEQHAFAGLALEEVQAEGSDGG